MSTQDSKKEVGATTEAPKPKGYVERFNEMENAIVKLSYVVNFHTNALNGLVDRLESLVKMVETLDVVRQSVNAMIKLSEENIKISLDTVSNKVAKLQQQAVKERLLKDVETGKIQKVEAVQGDESIVEFLLPGDDYGVSSAGTFPENLKTKLMGKKAGEELESVKILGVYEYAKEQASSTGEAKEEVTEVEQAKGE